MLVLANWSILTAPLERSTVWILLPSSNWRRAELLLTPLPSTRSGGIRRSSSADAVSRCGTLVPATADGGRRSMRREMAQEKRPLSVDSMFNWWSKLLSVSRMILLKSRWTAAMAWDKLFPSLWSCNNWICIILRHVNMEETRSVPLNLICRDGWICVECSCPRRCGSGYY